MAEQNWNPNARQGSRIQALLRRRSISRRLVTTAFISILSFGFIFAIVFTNARFIFSAFDKLVSDTVQEIQALNKIHIGTQALLSEAREYALLQDPETLNQIEETLSIINDNLYLLKEAGATIEEQDEIAKEAQAFTALEDKIQELENGVEQVIALVTADADDESIREAAEELEDIEQSLIPLFEEMRNSQAQESEEIITQINQRIYRTIITLAIGTFSLVALNLGINHFTADSIATPVQHLADTSIQIAGGDLFLKADESGKDEITILAKAFNQMNARQKELITSEADIAQKLQVNLAQLQASNQVAQIVASILDPTEIAERVVNLIREAFNLYYVGLFTPDERNEWAVLRAGTGEAGQIMMAREHRIKIGEGMIGWSIANAKARVAQVVGEDDLRLATQELPETRSEVAIPLRSRGQVVGALTVQDRQPNIFDEQLIEVLQNMADQVAIALDNARLFTESQKALEASRRAYAEISREAWAEFLAVQEDLNYLATPQVETRIQTSNWAPEMAETYSVGDITQHGEDTIHIPIILRDETLGVVRLCKQAGTGGWSNDEIQLMDTLVDRLEAALETARLYSNTQIQAERERLTHEVTDKLHRTQDMDTLMQALLQEISNALGASSAFVQLSTDLAVPESVNGNPILNK